MKTKYMICLLSFLLVVTSLHSSSSKVTTSCANQGKNTLSSATKKKKEKLSVCVTVVESCFKDEPIFPAFEKDDHIFYQEISRILQLDSRTISTLNKKSPQKNKYGTLYRTVLQRNFINSIVDYQSYTTLYYAILFEHTYDIYKVLKKHNPTIPDSRLIPACYHIPTCDNKPITFFTNNYQKNGEKIVNNYEKNRSKNYKEQEDLLRELFRKQNCLY